MPELGRFYKFTGKGLEMYNHHAQKMASIPASSDVPTISWPMGITYDSDRKKIAIVTLGGEGFLYEYDPFKNNWSVLASMENDDYKYITYDNKIKRYILIPAERHQRNNPSYTVFDPMTGKQEKKKISKPKYRKMVRSINQK